MWIKKVSIICSILWIFNILFDFLPFFLVCIMSILISLTSYLSKSCFIKKCLFEKAVLSKSHLFKSFFFQNLNIVCWSYHQQTLLFLLSHLKMTILNINFRGWILVSVLLQLWTTMVIDSNELTEKKMSYDEK